MKLYAPIPFFLALLMTGCFGDKITVQDEINAIDSSISKKVSESVELVNPEIIDYSVINYRSPFTPNNVYIAMKSGDYKLVRQNINRKRQALENYPLESLVVSGIVGVGKEKRVLIKTPDGNLKTVRMGDYLGLNQGRIVAASPERVDVIELIPTWENGLFIQRKNTVFADKATQPVMQQGAVVQPQQQVQPNQPTLN